jgi:3-oxoacyl-[acyl-carrier protein] reductase
MGRFSHKVAVVTGASRGIGRGIARRLALEGAAVVVNYRADESGAGETVRLIEEAGGTAVAVRGDVSLSEQAAALIDAAITRLGGVHILVNNAGVSKDVLTVRMSEEDWDRIVDTDLKGAFLTTRAALRPMIRQRWGSHR